VNSESPFANRSRVGSRICLRNARLCLVSSEKSIGIDHGWPASQFSAAGVTLSVTGPEKEAFARRLNRPQNRLGGWRAGSGNRTRFEANISFRVSCSILRESRSTRAYQGFGRVTPCSHSGAVFYSPCVQLCPTQDLRFIVAMNYARSLMRKRSKRQKVRRDEEPIIIPVEGGEEIRFTDPSACKCLRAIAKVYNRQHGTRLPAVHVLVRMWTEIWDHPVKSLRFGSVEAQDQLAPSDLLPVPVQFNNTRQD
jgi:hypothetical protein